MDTRLIHLHQQPTSPQVQVSPYTVTHTPHTPASTTYKSTSTGQSLHCHTHASYTCINNLQDHKYRSVLTLSHTRLIHLHQQPTSPQVQVSSYTVTHTPHTPASTTYKSTSTGQSLHCHTHASYTCINNLQVHKYRSVLTLSHTRLIHLHQQPTSPQVQVSPYTVTHTPHTPASTTYKSTSTGQSLHCHTHASYTCINNLQVHKYRSVVTLSHTRLIHLHQQPTSPQVQVSPYTVTHTPHTPASTTYKSTSTGQSLHCHTHASYTCINNLQVHKYRSVLTLSHTRLIHLHQQPTSPQVQVSPYTVTHTPHTPASTTYKSTSTGQSLHCHTHASYTCINNLQIHKYRSVLTLSHTRLIHLHQQHTSPQVQVSPYTVTHTSHTPASTTYKSTSTGQFLHCHTHASYTCINNLQVHKYRSVLTLSHTRLIHLHQQPTSPQVQVSPYTVTHMPHTPASTTYKSTSTGQSLHCHTHASYTCINNLQVHKYRSVLTLSHTRLIHLHQQLQVHKYRSVLTLSHTRLIHLHQQPTSPQVQVSAYTVTHTPHTPASTTYKSTSTGQSLHCHTHASYTCINNLQVHKYRSVLTLSHTRLIHLHQQPTSPQVQVSPYTVTHTPHTPASTTYKSTSTGQSLHCHTHASYTCINNLQVHKYRSVLTLSHTRLIHLHQQPTSPQVQVSLYTVTHMPHTPASTTYKSTSTGQSLHCHTHASYTCINNLQVHKYRSVLTLSHTRLIHLHQQPTSPQVQVSPYTVTHTPHTPASTTYKSTSTGQSLHCHTHASYTCINNLQVHKYRSVLTLSHTRLIHLHQQPTSPQVQVSPYTVTHTPHTPASTTYKFTSTGQSLHCHTHASYTCINNLQVHKYRSVLTLSHTCLIHLHQQPTSPQVQVSPYTVTHTPHTPASTTYKSTSTGQSLHCHTHASYTCVNNLQVHKYRSVLTLSHTRLIHLHQQLQVHKYRSVLTLSHTRLIHLHQQPTSPQVQVSPYTVTHTPHTPASTTYKSTSTGQFLHCHTHASYTCINNLQVHKYRSVLTLSHTRLIHLHQQPTSPQVQVSPYTVTHTPHTPASTTYKSTSTGQSLHCHTHASYTRVNNLQVHKYRSVLTLSHTRLIHLHQQPTSPQVQVSSYTVTHTPHTPASTTYKSTSTGQSLHCHTHASYTCINNLQVHKYRSVLTLSHTRLIHLHQQPTSPQVQVSSYTVTHTPHTPASITYKSTSTGQSLHCHTHASYTCINNLQGHKYRSVLTMSHTRLIHLHQQLQVHKYRSVLPLSHTRLIHLHQQPTSPQVQVSPYTVTHTPHTPASTTYKSTSTGQSLHCHTHASYTCINNLQVHKYRSVLTLSHTRLIHLRQQPTIPQVQVSPYTVTHTPHTPASTTYKSTSTGQSLHCHTHASYTCINNLQVHKYRSVLTLSHTRLIHLHQQPTSPQVQVSSYTVIQT